MHRCTQPRAVARRPYSPAQGAYGIGAPVQPDAVVGIARLGGKSLVKYALQVVLGYANAIVVALQMQLLAAALAHDLGGEVQYALLPAGVAHRVRGVDD